MASPTLQKTLLEDHLGLTKQESLEESTGPNHWGTEKRTGFIAINAQTGHYKNTKESKLLLWTIICQ